MKKFHFDIKDEKQSVLATSSYEALNKIERLYGLILSRNSIVESEVWKQNGYTQHEE